MKTFWEGFTDSQTPDGAVHITTPTGHTYRTTPFSALLFPTWNTATGPPPTWGPAPPRHPRRNLMMPTRRRTRDQNRAAYIRRERELNALQRSREREPEPEPEPEPDNQTPQDDPWHTYFDTTRTPDYGDDPPPF